MFARHMCSGRPVLADCAWTNSSGDLRAVAHRQRAVHVQLARLPTRAISSSIGIAAQHIAGALRLAHVALNQGRRWPADLGDRLAGREVHDLVDSRGSS